jgi:hypothetical protein
VNGPAGATRSLSPAGPSFVQHIAGGQGIYIRLTAAAGSSASGVLSVPVTVQNLTAIPFATLDGFTRDDEGMQVYLLADPVTTSGTGVVTLANADGAATFTGSNQSYFQYGGKLATVDQPDLGPDGILSSGETSTAKTWQFNIPATVTTFTFQAYVSSHTASAGRLATIAPQVTAISPATMVPGTSAVLTGYNFNLTPGSNVVKIGGQAAAVTAGTATELTVTVPCVSSGTQAVNVSDRGNRGADFQKALQVTQQTVAVGQSLVLTSAAASECIELTAAGDSARYIVAVFSDNTSPGSNSPVQISSDALSDAGRVEEAVAANRRDPGLTIPSRSVSGATGASIVDIINDAAEVRRSEKHDALMEQNARMYQSLRTKFGTAGRSRTGGSRDLVSADPALTRTFRISNINATAPNNICNSYYVVSATLVYWNGKLAIYEDDSTPAAFKGALNPTQASNYRRIGDQFNADMEPIVRTNFGDILRRDAVTDNNGIEIALFTPRINTSFTGVAGFVVSCDQFPNDDVSTPAVGGPYTGSAGSTNGASNFGEYFYAYEPVTAGTGYSGNTVDNWYRTIRSTFIHESKHIANFAARVANGAPTYESAWLEEGLARTSEELWMRNAVDNVAWKANTGYGSFATPINVYCDVRPGFPECDANPRRPASIMQRHFTSLYTELFGTNARLLSPFGPTPADNASYYYAISWSLIRYAVDRYGASDAAFLTALTNSTTSGVTNLTGVAGTSVDQLLGGWALSMYADDYPGLASPSADIQLPTWNWRSIYAGLNADFPATYTLPYPLVPAANSFGTNPAVGFTTLRGGGVLWSEFRGMQTAPQLLRLQGIGGGALPANVRLAVARLR